jgi:hypothetical protein
MFTLHTETSKNEMQIVHSVTSYTEFTKEFFAFKMSYGFKVGPSIHPSIQLFCSLSYDRSIARSRASDGQKRKKT